MFEELTGLEMHELIYYLDRIKTVIAEPVDPENPFVPKYMVVAVKLPSGAVELMVNNDHIVEKIDYILDSYDHTTGRLKSNPEVSLEQLMVV